MYLFGLRLLDNCSFGIFMYSEDMKKKKFFWKFQVDWGHIEERYFELKKMYKSFEGEKRKKKKEQSKILGFWVPGVGYHFSQVNWFAKIIWLSLLAVSISSR